MGPLKAFTFDANDNPVAVQDFLAAGGPIQALGDNPRTGDLYYISGLSELPGSAKLGLLRRPPSPRRRPRRRPRARGSANLPSAAARVQTTPSTQKVASPANKVTTAHPAQSTSGWSGGDIGAVAAAGSYSTSGGVFTVLGSGVDIYNTADSFKFVSQPLAGNGWITARVVSQTDTNV